MSDYELQRVKNMEENRRILESIRQEQVCRIHLYKHFIPPDLNSSSCRQIYKFEALQPAVVKKKERKPAEARPKKKPRLETEGHCQKVLWLMTAGENLQESVAR